MSQLLLKSIFYLPKSTNKVFFAFASEEISQAILALCFTFIRY